MFYQPYTIKLDSMIICYFKKYCPGVFAIVLLLAVQNSYGNPRFNSNRTSPDSVKGIVLDGYGEPLEHVRITVKGGASESFSDHAGKFAVAAKINATLIFEDNGYYRYETTVQNDQDLKIHLTELYLPKPDTLEVLYQRIPATSSIGAVSTIYTPQLTTTPSDNITLALQGRLAGLNTSQYSGFPSPNTVQTLGGNIGYGYNPNIPLTVGTERPPTDNGEITMSVRGQTPTVVIDGIQRELYSIDPDDIESISLLKDGLSTLLLGQNSSNPVLLITTRRAKPGVPRMSFTAETGLQTPVSLPTPLPAYQYAYLYNEARENSGQLPLYSAADIQAYKDGSKPYSHPNVNWFNTVLNKYAPMTRYNFMVGGGSAIATYHVSVGYLDQQGLFKSTSSQYNSNDDFQRYLINTNVEIKPTKNLNISVQLLGRLENSTQPGVGTQNLLNELYNTPNNASAVLNPNGSPGGSSNYQYNLYDQTVNSGYINTYEKDVVADLALRYNFNQWVPGLYFSAKGNFSILSSNDVNRGQSNYTYSYNTAPGDTSYTTLGASSVQTNTFNLTQNAQYVYGRAMLGYNQQFGKNSIDAALFTDVKSITLDLQLPFKTTNYALNGRYSYANKYFAQGILNYSGYDQFEPGHQFGFFYGGGLGWRLSQEDFIKDNVSWIDELKLRATYAKTGNDNVAYFAYRQSYANSGNYFFGAGTYNGPVTALAENTLADPNATWEKANKFDVGLDMAFLKNHFDVTLDYYNDRYYDLMESLSRISRDNVLIGNNLNAQNIGINRYTGVELTATYRDHIGKVNYFVTGNLSLLSTKVVYMDEIVQTNPFNARTGQPVGELFGYEANGLYQTQQQASSGPAILGYAAQAGDIRYKDIGGPKGKPDGVINQYDQVPIGQRNPLVYYGATFGFQYRGFDLSILLQGLGHSKIYLQPSAIQTPFYNAIAANTYIGQGYSPALGRWTPETAATASSPELSVNYNPYNQSPSTYWVRSGNYLALRNVDLGYTLPAVWASTLKVGSIRVYANCLNLFTLSNINLSTLEQNYTTTANSFGTQINYPIEKVFNIGLNVKF